MAYTTSEHAAPLSDISALEDLLPRIRSVIQRPDSAFVPLHEPVFSGKEREYVTDCIETGWVSSVGSYVDRFEKELAEFLGVKRVIATVNGTAALHLCLAAEGISTGDEVLVPGLTFVATANAVSYTGAKPHFCETDAELPILCPRKLENYLDEIATIGEDGYCVNSITGNKIKAVVPMHCFGHPVDMDALNTVAGKFNITVIEDAAESLGSTYKGRQTGGLARMGAISFNGNKIITSGGGGAVATNDTELGDLLKHMSTTAKVSGENFFDHDMVGYNYRLPNINAALGCAQLEQLTSYIETKRQIAARYRAAFDGYNAAEFLPEPEHTRSNYWLCAIRFNDDTFLQDALRLTHESNIMTRPVWTLMPDLPMYGNCPSMKLDNARALSRRIMTLPSSVNLL